MHKRLCATDNWKINIRFVCLPRTLGKDRKTLGHVSCQNAKSSQTHRAFAIGTARKLQTKGLKKKLVPGLLLELNWAGGGGSHMKEAGMTVVSLTDVNFGFWYHLGCSGENALYLAGKVSFRAAREEV